MATNSKRTSGRKRRTTGYTKRKNNTLKTITSATNKTLPIVNDGLKKIGRATKSTIPIVEKGVASVYGAMKSGVDLGTKTFKRARTSTMGKSRSLSLSGGRKSKKR